MSITIPAAPDVEATRAEYERLGKQLTAAREKHERAVDKALKDVTPDDIERLDDILTLLEAPGRRAYTLVGEWVTSLGSRDLRYSGVLLDEDSNGVGPAVEVWMPHHSDESYAARKQDLLAALGRYETFLAPVIDRLGADGLVVRIMDNDCSANGIPELYLASDGTCALAVTTYGHLRTEQEWPTLSEALDWLSRNRWYGEPYASSYDDPVW